MPTNTEDKLVVSGTFTGTKQTVFFVKITDEDGDAYQWKKRVAGAAWGSATDVTGITLNDEETLSDGVEVTFTAGSKTDYNDGDTWTFIAYPNFRISETTSAYTDMSIIEHADRKDIVAISKGSGDVSVIEDYESSAPKRSKAIYNIGASDSIDMQNRNKEIYVATGRNNKPKWVGYVSHNGLSGSISEPEFVVQDSLDLIEADDAIEADAFTDFVVMESTGSGSALAKLIVGIKEGDNHLYVMNIDDNELFKFECLSQPLRVRADYDQPSGTADELKGVAVLCTGQNVADKNYINSIEYWSMTAGSVEGEGANRDKIIHLNVPEQQPMERFTDFLIVPTQYNATTHYSGGDFVLVVSTSTASATGTLEYPVFKYENVDALTNGSEIATTAYTSISPKINWDGEDGGAGKFVYLKKTSTEYNSTHAVDDTNGYENQWKHVADCNLVFGCHDGTATTTVNPTVMFTGQLLPAVEYEEEEDFDTEHYFGPVFQDSTSDTAKAYWIVNWATFNIPVSATGVSVQPMLMHIKDNISNGANANNAWRDYPGGSPFNKHDWLGAAICNRYMPPANNPNFGNNRKFLVLPTQQGSAPGRRGWVVYVDAGSRRVRTFFTPLKGSEEYSQWILTTIPHVFPNKSSFVYTKYGDATSISSAYDDQPSNVSFYLGAGSWRDGRRWRLGDQPFQVTPDLGSPRMPNLDDKIFVMSPLDSEYSDSTVRKFVSSIVGAYTGSGVSRVWSDEDATPTNLLGNLTDWLTFTTPVKTNTSDNWVGSDTVKKVFYKASLVYDGYQESNLMSADIVFSDSSVMDEPLKFDIKIDANAEIPRRVKSIVIYRADSILNTDTEPDGLYRFVKEIDLVKFNWNSSTQIWEYTLIDSGSSEGSYGSINGVSEGIHSLILNYSISAEQNGYLFVGNCNHTQFEDSENFLFRSQPGKFSIFDWSKDFLQLPFVPTALAGFMGKVYVFGATQMAVINPESMYIEDTLKGVGCMGQKSVYSTSYGLFWVDKTNVYLASPQIKKVGTPMLEADSHGWLGLSDSVKESSVIGYDSRRKSYLIFFTNTDNRCWAYNTQDNRWDLWETPGEVMDSAYTSDGHSLLLLSDGTICKYLSGPNRRNWTFVSKKLTLGSDTQDKKLRNVKLDASIDNNSNALPRTRLYYKVDGTSWQNGTDISSSSSGDNNTIKKVIAADNKNHWIQMKATGENDASASDARGYSMGVVYKPKSIK